MRFIRPAIFCLALSVILGVGAFAAPPAFAQTTPATNHAAGQNTGADQPIPIHTEIPIPTSPVEQGVSHYSNGIVRDAADYIQVLYNFLISIAGLVAAVMMIIGGFQYLTSAGDASKISVAKKRIGDAVIGLVLALGSYALLNTINPALLQFKPISEGVSAVATHLSFLSWCDDIEAQGISVQQVAGKECGNVGRYKLGTGLQDCIYRGSCTPDKKSYNFGYTDYFAMSHGVETCLQKSGLNTKTIDDALAHNISSGFAICTPCANISPNVAKSLNMDIEAACTAWEDEVNTFRAKTTNQPLWSYCGKGRDHNTCIQADINCQGANHNTPDSINNSGTFSNSCGDDNDCGCGGYDDSPTPVWLDTNPTLEEVATFEGQAGGKYTHMDTLDNLQLHLTNVCTWNPCQDYLDPRTNKKSFANGCKTDAGFFSAVVHTVRRGIGSLGESKDCRNR